MRARTIFVTLIVFLAFQNTYGQNSDSTKIVNCVLKYDVRSIPPGVRSAIQSKNKTRFAMANPGEKFQMTDVISEYGLNDRRLVFWATCQERVILFYEHGGWGYHKHIIEFLKQRNKYSISKNISGDNVKTLQDVIRRLNDNDAAKKVRDF